MKIQRIKGIFAFHLFQCGSILHAQLEIWKAAVEESPRNTLAASWGPAVVQTPNNNNNASSTIANAAPASVTGSTCSVDFSDGKLICYYDFIISFNYIYIQFLFDQFSLFFESYL